MNKTYQLLSWLTLADAKALCTELLGGVVSTQTLLEIIFQNDIRIEVHPDSTMRLFDLDQGEVPVAISIPEHAWDDEDDTTRNSRLIMERGVLEVCKPGNSGFKDEMIIVQSSSKKRYAVYSYIGGSCTPSPSVDYDPEFCDSGDQVFYLLRWSHTSSHPKNTGYVRVCKPDLQRVLSSASIHASPLQGSLDSLRSELEKAEAALDAQKAQLDHLNSQLDAHKAENSNLKETLRNSTAELHPGSQKAVAKIIAYLIEQRYQQRGNGVVKLHGLKGAIADGAGVSQESASKWVEAAAEYLPKRD